MYRYINVYLSDKIYLVQNAGKWLAAMYTVMKLQVRSLLTEELDFLKDLLCGELSPYVRYVFVAAENFGVTSCNFLDKCHLFGGSCCLGTA